jgi:hypothetical protein
MDNLATHKAAALYDACTSAKANMDMNKDSLAVAKDAYGYSIGYYTNDYKPIGGTSYTAFALKYTSTTGDITGQSLYNGNISNTTLAINQLGSPVGYTYRYHIFTRLSGSIHILSPFLMWKAS